MLNHCLFSPAYLGIPQQSTTAAGRVSFPHPAFGTLKGLQREAKAVTPNSGNMMHAEAMPRIVDCNRQNSAVGAIPLLIGDSPDKAREKVRRFEENTKVLFFGFANIIHDIATIKPDAMEKMAEEFDNRSEFLELFAGKVIVTGVGLQNEMPAVPESIMPSLYRMLKLIDEKAAIFGVRGARTEAWLHELGLKNAVAHGCPSLYVNPWAIEALEPRAFEDIVRVTTAGYFSLYGWRGGRMKAIVKFADAFARSDYVFQNDLYQFVDVPHGNVAYNPVTGEVDKAYCQQRFADITGRSSPFGSFRFFNNPELWRGYASQRDFYFGDRFHGGVAHLQAGIPAAFVYKDPRVEELTSFFGMPAFSVEEANELSPQEIVARSTSATAIAHLKSRYAVRLRAFRKAMAAVGVPLLHGKAKVAAPEPEAVG